MKKVISWFLLIAVTAALTVGITLAYLQDTDDDVNVSTIGNVHIVQTEQERVDTETGGLDAPLQDFHDGKPLYPTVTDKTFDWESGGTDLWDPTKINNEVDKIITVTNTGDYNAYVRTVIAFEAGNYVWEQFKEKVHLNINQTDWSWEWNEETSIIGNGAFFIATATYKTPLAPGETTAPSLLQVALDSSAENRDVQQFGPDYVIMAASQAIQTDGFHVPETALETGFYKVTKDKHPFSSDMLPFYIYDASDFIDFGVRGGTGILMTDITMETYALFNRPDTLLDMNGHTIYNNMYSNSRAYIFRVDYGGELTVTGNGKVIPIQDLDKLNCYISAFIVTAKGSVLTVENGFYDASHGDYVGNILIQCQSNGKVIINGGEFIRKDCPDAGDLIYSRSGGSIEINGGLFRNDGYPHYLLNTTGYSPITIRGGTFVNHNPGVSQDPGIITVAEGYKTISEVRADGNTYYTVVPE